MFQLFPLAAFLGLLVGVLLAFIAPEELSRGKRFFELSRKILLIMLMLSIAYGVRTGQMLLVVGIVGLIIIVINIRWPRLWMEGINYLFALAISIFIEEPLLAATTLFLYGLPVGTILRMEYVTWKKHEG